MTTPMPSTDEDRERIEVIAQRHVPHLMRLAERCRELAVRMARGAADPSDDDLAFMALRFLQRQSEHLKSLLLLVPRRDTLLIARSMLEGYAQLLWAAQVPEVRAKRWRTFAAVAEWRAISGQARAGYAIDPKRFSEAAQAILRQDSLLLTSVGLKAMAHGAPLQDHYMHKDWRCGTTLGRILQDLESPELVDLLYSPYADWHHWGAWEIGQCIEGAPGTAPFTETSPRDVASALTMGIKSAARTMRFADDRLHLGHAARIDALLRDLAQWLERNAATLMG